MSGPTDSTERNDDAARLAAVRESGLLDTPPEEAFDRLSRVATRVLHAPVALVSLVDDRRQFFKSCIGLPKPWTELRQTPLSHSFCRHVVASRSPLIIPDARHHPVLRNNPAVMDLNVCAYAGIPLLTSDGQALGSFCVIDSKPRQWTDDELSILSDLAASVMSEIESRSIQRESQRRADALRHSELRYRSLVTTTSQMVWTTDAGGQVVEASESWSSFTGQTFEEFRGSGWLDAVHPDDRPGTRSAWLSSVRENKPLNEIEYRVRHRDGAWRSVVARGAPVRGTDGAVVEWIGTCTDVTDQTLARQALRESEERLRIALETARLGSWDVDLTRGCMTSSPRCKANFGLPPDAEFHYPNLLRAIHPDDREAVQQAVKKALDERSIYESCYRARWPDGTTHWILASGRGIYDAFGRPVRMTGVTLDVTERKEADERRQRALEAERHARGQAERNSRMKDEFLATLSHELRTPLNAILGWAQILRSGTADDNDRAEGLEVIERNARAQTQLIGDLLDMSRIVSGKIVLDRQPVDLVGVIAAAIETIRPAAQAKQLRVQPALGARQAVVSGDAHRLQQVLWNLLTNAVKFTPAGGTIRVVLGREGKNARIQVIDSGEGISAEFLPHVFGRFRQADAAPSRRFGGLGLGLAIARHLVELHGGTISAESGGPGTGATFAVALPLCESAPRMVPPAQEPVFGPLATRRLRRVNVLVVDDEPDARHLVRRVLESADARVITAGSAAEAFLELARGPVDLLICDLGMPEVDGYALIRKLRLDQSSPARAVPAVALTAYARGEEQARALESGFQVHIAKPFKPDDLLNTVAALTENVPGE